MSELNVYMNGELVGVWSETRAQSTFKYAESWMQSEHFRYISLSMYAPFSRKVTGDKVRHYFDNLLPDSTDIRKRLAGRFRLARSDAFALLQEIGRDCIGAIQLVPSDQQPPDVFKILGYPVDDAVIADHLRAVPKSAINVDEDVEDFRISIAGAQEKTALLKHEGNWYFPAGATPTTHILKLPLGLVGGRKLDLSHSVENEWLCSKISAAFGIQTAHCDIGQFEDQKVLIVKRFDRKLSDDGSWIVRLPQEDICQALGVSSHAKYQSHGGPSITDIHRVLNNSANAAGDLVTFFKAQVLFFLLVATDGHAKNYSIRHAYNNAYQLTPVYDILSASPIIGRGHALIDYNNAKLAMAIRSSKNHYHFRSILYRHYQQLAAEMKIPETTSGSSVLDDMLDSVDDVIDMVANQLPAGFDQLTADRIFVGMKMQRDRLFKGR